MLAGKDDAEVGFSGISPQCQQRAELCNSCGLGNGKREDCASLARRSGAEAGIHTVSGDILDEDLHRGVGFNGGRGGDGGERRDAV